MVIRATALGVIGGAMLLASAATASGQVSNVLQGEKLFAGVTFMASAAPAAAVSASAPDDAGVLELQRRFRDPDDRPHKFGVGVKFGGGYVSGPGLTIRDWLHRRIAFQLDISHYGFAGNLFGGFSLTQVAPSLIFVLGHPDLRRRTHVRPYVGIGLNVSHFSYSDTFALNRFSGSGLGYQVFFGSEFVFRRVPWLGVGGDLGYYSAPNAGTYFSGGGINLSLTAHLYFD